MATANGWRRVARVVLEGLDQVVGTPEETTSLIDPAIAKFEAQVQLLRAIRCGASIEEATAGYVDPAPDGVSPTTLLEDARRNIQRRRSLHGLACGVPLCANKLGLGPNEAWREIWESCNRTALRFTRRMEECLRNAASLYMAARDAIDLASVLPIGAPLRVAWMEAAELLTVDAVREARALHNRVVLMRQILLLQSRISTHILQPAL
ncbi:hypothetical protein ZWY2020_006575 [Hordeum vulgare]|nr:hypothetical protein ZWY2020_006575 [Hordeum vulgare]